MNGNDWGLERAFPAGAVTIDRHCRAETLCLSGLAYSAGRCSEHLAGQKGDAQCPALAPACSSRSLVLPRLLALVCRFLGE